MNGLLLALCQVCLIILALIFLLRKVKQPYIVAYMLAGVLLGPHMLGTIVNVKETETGFALEILAPGVRKEDLKLNINDKTLTIAFEQKEEQKQESEKWIRNEFKVRSFKRSFTLGDQIDTDKIAASFENGILNLTLPKKEAAIVTNKVIDIA